MKQVGLKLLVALTFFIVTPAAAEAASLYLSPSSGRYSVGQTVSIVVRVDTDGQSINAADGTITFPKELLDFQSIGKGGSVFTLWPSEPSGSDSSGSISFSGGLPSPGFTGSAGTVMTMNFKARTTGTANLQITSGTILANDGQGTNILTGRGSASFTLSATTAPAPSAPTSTQRVTPTLSSNTHPDQVAWYSNLPAAFSFSKPSGLLGVSYELTSLAGTVPDEAQDLAGDSIDLELPGDGVWYFHLRGLYASGWSEAAHFKIQIDRTPPLEFRLQLERDNGDKDATPTIAFSTTDALSGVSRYTVRLNGSDAEVVESPTTLHLTRGGEQLVSVTAIDQAGNERVSELAFTFVGYPPPILTYVTNNMILLQDLLVRGTASSGDLVTLYVDGEKIGEVIAGREIESGDITVRVPWTFITDRLFAPGMYELTATATSPDGKVSSSTDPQKINVQGASIIIGGRPYLTIAAAPIAASAVVLLLLINALVFWKMYIVLKRHFERERKADRDIQNLERRLRKEHMGVDEIEAELDQIDSTLKGPKPRARGRKRKR